MESEGLCTLHGSSHDCEGQCGDDGGGEEGGGLHFGCLIGGRRCRIVECSFQVRRFGMIFN